MNEWDVWRKEAEPEGTSKREPEQQELPEGFSPDPCPFDGYGIYGVSSAGKLTLIRVSREKDRTEYALREGCVAIASDAFSDQPYLEELRIPSSVTEIPEGALSNSGSWAQEEPGITRIVVDSFNPCFYTDENGLYQRKRPGEKKLLRWLNPDREARMPEDLTGVGEKAFYGRQIDQISFPGKGYCFALPKHRFFREELLMQFGKNGKIYDFTEYDAFLLRNHYSPERIRLLCGRVEQPLDLSEEMKNRLILHLRANLEEVLKSLAEENAIAELMQMTRIGVFIKDNIHQAVEQLNQTDRREMLTYLMDYQHTHFSQEEFDFTI